MLSFEYNNTTVEINDERQIKKGRGAFCSRHCNGDYQRKHTWKPT